MKHVSAYLDEAFREMFEERAGILEYSAGLSRDRAEELAREEIETRKAQRDHVDSGKVAK